RLRKPGVEAELDLRPLYELPEYRGSGKLEGKVALITGGDSGIGRAVSVLYAREGADVALAYVSEHGDAEETRTAVMRDGRCALLIPGDVSDEGSCREAVEKTVREMGHLNILVNNGADQQNAASPEELSEENWDLSFHTN